MKRSEINAYIAEALDFTKEHGFFLPAWATWRPADWKGRGAEVDEIVENMLGWDITDFSSEDYARRGLLLFTMRNGNPSNPDGKTYCEKLLIAEENQETPCHFHWNKREDIINRGAGRLALELWPATPDETLGEDPLEVRIDGVRRRVEAGEKVVLGPGESICLEPYVYHRFYGEPGAGRVLAGEVSAVNDDTADNRFLEPLGRFPGIEEDEEPLHLLATDYRNYL